MRILCLFVRHGVEAHPGALEMLDGWYERHGLLAQRTLWVIDNALPPDASPVELAPGRWLRAGDNRAWEFSAWERALREARAEAPGHEVIHCVTSAFHTLYTGYLGHFQPDMLDYVLDRKVCLGHIDSHPTGFELEGRHFDSWIRTCFFFLARPVADAVHPWVQQRDPARYFRSRDSTAFREEAPLSPGYRHHLTAWLHGAEIGGHRWHSPVGGGAAEVARFQHKVGAILNEHEFSLTLGRLGLSAVDFCWLYRQPRPAGGSGLPPPVTVPEQLAVRRRHLGIADPIG